MFDISALSLTFLLSKILPAIIVLVAGWILIGVIKKGINALLEKNSKTIDPMLRKFINNAVSIVLWIVLLFAVCGQLGIDTKSFLTVFATCGAAVALALKDSLSNIAGGVLIMVTKPFSYGDYITCGGNSGSVESIDLLHTTIVTVDNQVVIIPNGTLSSSSITNATKLEKRRVDINIDISYESDIEAAKKAVLAIAEADDRFIKTIPMTCNVIDYAGSAIILQFRGWCKTSNYWDCFFLMNNSIKGALDAAGVEIPYQQVDVHMKEK